MNWRPIRFESDCPWMPRSTCAATHSNSHRAPRQPAAAHKRSLQQLLKGPVMSKLSMDLKLPAPLEGGMLWVGGIVLALANFVAVLNMTIANVTVPNIAGALGAGSSQGTWVITSYAVAEAITVPLTGWLAGRFGTARVFGAALVAFAMVSFLCALSPSIEVLVGLRVLQGVSGGPLIPLSQTLMLRLFPERLR